MATADYSYVYSVALTDGPYSIASTTNPYYLEGRADPSGALLPKYTNLQFSGSAPLTDGTHFSATATQTLLGGSTTVNLNLELLNAGYDSQGTEGYIVGVTDSQGNLTGQYFYVTNTAFEGTFGSGPTPDSTITDLNNDPMPACFCAGTMIRTPEGEVAVETLARGDLVCTQDGRVVPVDWLGIQTVSTIFADKHRVLPIRIKAGALGENVPARDLRLSPDHAVLVEGALIQSGALVNGTSIVRESNVPTRIKYYHVEVEDHSLILAENAPAETFVDNVDRLAFDNWAEHQALYPEGKSVSELPYPRAKAHRQVPVNIRVMLAERARLIGAVADTAAVA